MLNKKLVAYQRDFLGIWSPFSVFKVSILIDIQTELIVTMSEFKKRAIILLKESLPAIYVLLIQ